MYYIQITLALPVHQGTRVHKLVSSFNYEVNACTYLCTYLLAMGTLNSVNYLNGGAVNLVWASWRRLKHGSQWATAAATAATMATGGAGSARRRLLFQRGIAL